MQLTEIRINLCATSHEPVVARHGHGSRLRAFCSLTFDNTFVIRDVKLIEGNDGLFLAMPSRKLSDHCPDCGEKNHLRARYCNQCGGRLNEDRYLQYRQGNGTTRLKLHADVAHPINARCRQQVEKRVVDAYWFEVQRSKLPGYVPPSLDHEDFDIYDSSLSAPARALPVEGLQQVGAVH
ncbi:SpoVG family protein [Humisphaera borealis]|uniref:Septation protein SpoVG family protein n=1 Tax=Humisphaera borealis TaxID=2807512 RepID=A0A7M2X3K9_9BACT|nr:SpoVG family protein [Humisphaera borealis]QOV92209.1 septation protein SpoVG family protein [Humisphaera borealis]